MAAAVSAKAPTIRQRLRRRRRSRAPFALAFGLSTLVACAYDNPAYDAAPSGPASATLGEVTTDAGSSSTTTAAAVSSSTEADATATVDPTSSTGEGTSTSDTSGEPPFHDAADCDELRDVVAVSGLYTLPRPAFPDETVVVYCDMETDGGGWTLVARSVPGGAPGNFGWRARTGHPGGDGSPYSLSLQDNPFSFTEVLVGTYSAGKAWGEALFVIGVPSDLVLKHQNIAAPVHWITPLGPCAPPGGPAKLQAVGFTARATSYFFNEVGSADELGLRADGFMTAAGCDAGGDLDGAPGMIMIR